MFLEKPISPATKLLYDVWESVQSNKSMWSWLRLNTCMHEALSLAIKSAMFFNLDDFTYIANNFNWGRWVGDAEWVYSEGITENNKSAIYAFEKHRERKPFITNDVSFQLYSGGRGRERLAVGFSFVYNNERVTVTSFNDAERLLIACSYKPREPNSFSDKVNHIYKISHKDLKLNG